MITLRQLEIFAAAARHGSFRRCADELGVSQVTISEHIRALEDRLGRALFERRPGGSATLTEVGQYAQSRVGAILADIGDFVDEMAGRGRDGIRTVAVAMHPFMMRNLHDTLADFRKTRSEVDLRLDLGDHPIETLLAKVADRRLDLAYLYALSEADAPGTALLREEKLALFVGRDHPLGSSSPVSPAELREAPAIHLSPHEPLRGLIDRALESVGAGGGPIDVECSDFGLLLHSVRSNQGFVCMFRASEDEMTASYGLRRVELDPPLPALQVRIATRRSSARDPVIREVRAAIGIADTCRGGGF